MSAGEACAVNSAQRSGISELLAAYRTARYEVLLPDRRLLTLRVGRIPPTALSDWIEPAALAVFLSASNPHSRPLSAARNAARHAALRDELEDRGCRLLQGMGRSEDGAWREPGLLIVGLNLTVIDGLARRFGQNAALRLQRGASARLRLYRPEWRGALSAADDLEWAELVEPGLPYPHPGEP